MKTARYKNPWHNPQRTGDAPEYYTTDVLPALYRDFEVYHRIKSYRPGGNCFDVVYNGVCVAQMAGFKGALDLISGIYDHPGEYWQARAISHMNPEDQARFTHPATPYPQRDADAQDKERIA